MDLFIIFGLLSSTHSYSFSPHRAYHTSHKLIASTIISSSRGRQKRNEREKEDEKRDVQSTGEPVRVEKMSEKVVEK